MQQHKQFRSDLSDANLNEKSLEKIMTDEELFTSKESLQASEESQESSLERTEKEKMRQ